jgi:hypothetical protein
VRRVAVAVALAASAAAASAAPPDLTGVWSIATYRAAARPADGAAPPLTPEAKAEYDRHVASARRGDRAFDEVATRCLPPGLPRLMLIDKPFEILQKDRIVYFVYQENRLPRRVYFGESLPENPDPLYLGFSVARWEGDALVIESSGFRDETLLDDSGLPHSDALRLIERYELSKDGKTLRARFTITDPKTFTRPWNTEVQYRKRPGFEIPEEVCADRLETTRPPKRGS